MPRNDDLWRDKPLSGLFLMNLEHQIQKAVARAQLIKREPERGLLDLEKKSYHLPKIDSPPIKQVVNPELRKRSEEMANWMVGNLNRNVLEKGVKRWGEEDFAGQLRALLYLNKFNVEIVDESNFDFSVYEKSNLGVAGKWVNKFYDELEDGSFDNVFYDYITWQNKLKAIRDSYVLQDTAKEAYGQVLSFIGESFFYNDSTSKNIKPD